MSSNYNHQPSAPNKGVLSYLLPFLIIIALGVLLVLVYNFFLHGSSSDRFETDAKAYLFVEEGSTKVKLWGEDRFTSAHNGDTLYSGDIIATAEDALVELKLFDKSIIRLDGNTELSIDQLKTGDAKMISLTLEKGNIWVNTSDDPAELMIGTENTLAVVDGTTFAMEAGSDESLYVFDGSVSLSVLRENDITKRREPVQKFEVETGEQIILTSEKVETVLSGGLTAPEDAEEGDTEDEGGEDEEETTEIVFVESIDESYKTTEWFKWNATQDGKRYAFEGESGEEDEKEDDEESESEEEVTEEEEEETASAEKVLVVTSPTDNETFSKSSIEVEGTLWPSRVVSVEVNGVSADVSDDTWSADVTLAEGSNKLTVIAYDAEDGTVETQEITVARDTVPPQPPVVTSPEEGTEFTSSEGFQIKGTTSAETNKVIITDSAQGYAYTLSAYLPGESTWTYNASSQYGNLKEGENTYSVVAVDKAGNKSSATEITVTYDPEEVEESEEEEDEAEAVVEEDSAEEEDGESGSEEGESDVEENESEEGEEEDGEEESETEEEDVPKVTSLPSPIITIPTAAGEYSTTLDQIAIGGTVNQNTAKVYVNGTAIGYEAGKTRWNALINLEEGENTFTVSAEAANGVMSEITTIIITREE